MKVIGYEWRLREVMASAGIFSTTKLIPLLQDRGYRLVKESGLPACHGKARTVEHARTRRTDGHPRLLSR